MFYPQPSYTFSREQSKALWTAVSFFLEHVPEGSFTPEEYKVLKETEEMFSLELKD